MPTAQQQRETVEHQFAREMIGDAIESLENVLEMDRPPTSIAVVAPLKVSLTSLRSAKRTLENGRS